MSVAKADYKMLSFVDAAAWRAWLMAHHADTSGVWLRMYKKATGIPTVTYAEALDDALCFGWIDGQRKSYDEQSFIQRFTPRRKQSLWSKRNVEYIARLTAAGRMMPAGVAEVERAKADGRWAAAYDRQTDMTIPDDFTALLSKHPKAALVFEKLNKSSRYDIGWQLQTAKTEATRLRRMEKIIVMLEAGQ